MGHKEHKLSQDEASVFSQSTAWKRSEDAGAVLVDPERLVPLECIVKALRIYDVVKETPLTYAHTLSETTGCACYLKREDLQDVFSFKIRGSHNLITKLATTGSHKPGIVACSAGNHAQGVALSSQRNGVSAKVFMPVVTPEIKVANVRRLGGEAVLVGNTYDEAYAACLECAKTEKRSLVHAFDDDVIIAGNGTAAMEILKQIPEKLENVHAIFAAIGGGGLIAGIGSMVKQTCPWIKVIGVEADDAAGMNASLLAGKVVTLSEVCTFADGAAVKTVGTRTLEICLKGGALDEIVLVSTGEICEAVKSAFSDTRVILEPAGALAIAGMKKYIKENALQNTKTKMVAVCSGANMDFDKLRFATACADTLEKVLAVIAPEEPSSLQRLFSIIHPVQVTEIAYRITERPRRYRALSKLSLGNNSSPRPREVDGFCESGADTPSTTYSPTGDSPTQHVRCDDNIFTCTAKARVCISVRATEVRTAALIAQLKEEGYQAWDMSKCELTKLHGRHMLGGQPMAAENEVVYRFEFPEKPGALKHFLEEVSTDWNISLFHYRNHGADRGRALVGLQVLNSDAEEFKSFLSNMGARGYVSVEETSNPFYRAFMCSRAVSAETCCLTKTSLLTPPKQTVSAEAAEEDVADR